MYDILTWKKSSKLFVFRKNRKQRKLREDVYFFLFLFLQKKMSDGTLISRIHLPTLKLSEKASNVFTKIDTIFNYFQNENINIRIIDKMKVLNHQCKIYQYLHNDMCPDMSKHCSPLERTHHFSSRYGKKKITGKKNKKKKK